jgi:Fungalysin metallopeptidase (M36)
MGYQRGLSTLYTVTTFRRRLTMAINFVPNDPAAGAAAPGIREQPKRPTRPANRSGFVYSQTSPQGKAPIGTPKFLFWQAREAAIAAVEAWEASAGPHKLWQGDRKKLALLQDDGVDLNAFYDRQSFSFFHQAVGNNTFFSGASTDVVAHEVGHGLLDSVRPEFFDVNFLEVGAFHEAFGDCIAILTALRDSETRTKLLATAPTLRKRNFVESTAEDLSRGIGLAIPGHNAAEPRHAFNTFKFQIPSTLPSNGGPGALINEVHSFGMIFTGCFWDLIANLYAGSAQKNEASLLTASRLAGELLITGIKQAVVTPRFTQSVGRAMTLADQSLHNGAHHDQIRDAFAKHDVGLGSNAMLAPSMLLEGAAPKGAALSATTRKALMQRLGNSKNAKLSLSAEDMFGTQVVRAVQTRNVPLGSVDSRLKGVVAVTQEPVIVGASGHRAAVLGAVPHTSDTDAEVQAFVESLLEHGRIELGKPKKRAMAAAAAPDQHPKHTTHAIKTVGGTKVLKRVRFQCSCC